MITKQLFSARAETSSLMPSRRYATHSFDRYPAKMVPHLARYAIECYSNPQSVVLDPFCGCGTTLVEALISGRSAIGIDVNPVAVLLSRAKSSIYDVDLFDKYVNDVLKSSRNILPKPTKNEKWLNYWFSNATLNRLIALRKSIDEKRIPKLYKDLLRSVLIVSTRLCSRADPRSPKPFISKTARRDRCGIFFDPFIVYRETASKLIACSRDLFARLHGNNTAQVIDGDSKALVKTISQKVDTVITSPPYLAAQDYYRSSKLELAISGLAFEKSELGGNIIGSGRGALADVYDDGFLRMPQSNWLKRIGKTDHRNALMVYRYLKDMGSVIECIRSIIHPAGNCCFVVGDSRIAGINLPVHQWIIDLFAVRGFTLKSHEIDKIRDRRVPPKREGHSSVINCEHLLVFQRKQ